MASVPVDRRKEGEEFGNHTSNILVKLPVDLDDPAAIVHSIHETTTTAKAAGQALDASILDTWLGLMPAALLTAGAALYSRLGLGKHHPPLFNTIVSNMPGPPMPLYLAGARLVALYPMGPLIANTGLNLTVLSHDGKVDVGIIACPDLVDDVGEVADRFVAAVGELVGVARRRHLRRGGRPDRRRPGPRSTVTTQMPPAPTGRRGNVPGRRRADHRQPVPRRALRRRPPAPSTPSTASSSSLSLRRPDPRPVGRAPHRPLHGRHRHAGSVRAGRPAPPEPVAGVRRPRRHGRAHPRPRHGPQPLPRAVGLRPGRRRAGPRPAALRRPGLARRPRVVPPRPAAAHRPGLRPRQVPRHLVPAAALPQRLGAPRRRARRRPLERLRGKPDRVGHDPAPRRTAPAVGHRHPRLRHGLPVHGPLRAARAAPPPRPRPQRGHAGAAPARRPPHHPGQRRGLPVVRPHQHRARPGPVGVGHPPPHRLGARPGRAPGRPVRHLPRRATSPACSPGWSTTSTR